VRDGGRQQADLIAVAAVKGWSLPHTPGVLSRWKNGALHHFNQNTVNGHRTTLSYPNLSKLLRVRRDSSSVS
jgi:hypothetical protein